MGLAALPMFFFLCFCKNPGMSQGFPLHSYSFRMGLEPEKSYSREGSGFLGAFLLGPFVSFSGSMLVFGGVFSPAYPLDPKSP